MLLFPIMTVLNSTPPGNPWRGMKNKHFLILLTPSNIPEKLQFSAFNIPSHSPMINIINESILI